MKGTIVKLTVFFLFSAACMGWLFLRIGEFGGSAGAFRPTYKLTASFSDATGLVKGDEVRLAGVRIGKVGSLEVKRGKAVAKINVDTRHRLPDGSRFELRWKNLLGQRFVQVVPPDGATLDGPVIKPDAAIGADRTAAAADLSTLLNNTQPILAKLDTPTLNRVMATFASALQGREASLNQAIGDSSRLVSMLSQRADLIGNSITDFATLLDGIAGHDAEVRKLLDSLAATSETLAARADDLGEAAGKTGVFTTTLARILQANGTDVDTALAHAAKLAETAANNKESLSKALQTLPWATSAILRMTSNGDWIQSYTRAVGFIDAYASEPRVGPNYNDVGPDDPKGPDPLLGTPRVPLPPIGRHDAGIVAINPEPGADDQQRSSSGLEMLLNPLFATGAGS